MSHVDFGPPDLNGVVVTPIAPIRVTLVRHFYHWVANRTAGHAWPESASRIPGLLLAKVVHDFERSAKFVSQSHDQGHWIHWRGFTEVDLSDHCVECAHQQLRTLMEEPWAGGDLAHRGYCSGSPMLNSRTYGDRTGSLRLFVLGGVSFFIAVPHTQQRSTRIKIAEGQTIFPAKEVVKAFSKAATDYKVVSDCEEGALAPRAHERTLNSITVSDAPSICPDTTGALAWGLYCEIARTVAELVNQGVQKVRKLFGYVRTRLGCTTICENPSLFGMPVEVQKCCSGFASAHQFLQGEHFRRSVNTGLEPATIQVNSCNSTSVVPVDDSVGIEHRDHLPCKLLPEGVTHTICAQQTIQEALHHKWSRGFTGMSPCSEENRWLVWSVPTGDGE